MTFELGISGRGESGAFPKSACVDVADAELGEQKKIDIHVPPDPRGTTKAWTAIMPNNSDNMNTVSFVDTGLLSVA